MKRFKAAAQRATAFVLAASMMSSAVLPTVFAAQPLNAENSVDELGNVDVADEDGTLVYPEWDDDTAEDFQDEGDTIDLSDAEFDSDGDIATLAARKGTQDYIDKLKNAYNELKKKYDAAVTKAKQDAQNAIDNNKDFKDDHDPKKSTVLQELEKHDATCMEDGNAKYKCTRVWKGYPVKETVKNPIASEYKRLNRVVQIAIKAGLKKIGLSPIADQLDKDQFTLSGTIDLKCQHDENDPIVVKTGDALGHDFEGAKWIETDPATCDKDGVETLYCIRCHGTEEGGTKTRAILSANVPHTLGDLITEEPTCEKTGRTYRVCSVCGAEVEESTIPKLDHVFENYVKDDNPACQDQTETGTCTRIGCGKTDTRTISGPLSPHKFTTWTGTGISVSGQYLYYESTCDTCHTEPKQINVAEKKLDELDEALNGDPLTATDDELLEVDGLYNGAKAAITVLEYANKHLGISFDTEKYTARLDEMTDRYKKFEHESLQRGCEKTASEAIKKAHETIDNKSPSEMTDDEMKKVIGAYVAADTAVGELDDGRAKKTELQAELAELKKTVEEIESKYAQKVIESIWDDLKNGTLDKTKLEALKKTLDDLKDYIPDSLKESYDQVVDAVQAAIDAIDLVNEASALIKQLQEEIKNGNVSEDTLKKVQDVIDRAGALVDKIKENPILKNAVDTIIKNAEEAIKEAAATKALEALKKAIESGDLSKIEEAFEKAQEAIDQLEPYAPDVAKKLRDALEEIKKTYVNGLRDALENALEDGTYQEKLEKLKDVIKKYEDLIKDIDASGALKDLWETIKNEQLTKLVADAVNEINRIVNDKDMSALEKIAALNKLSDDLHKQLEDIVGKDRADKLLEPFDKLIEQAKETVAKAAAAAGNSLIKEALKAIKQAVNSAESKEDAINQMETIYSQAYDLLTRSGMSAEDAASKLEPLRSAIDSLKKFLQDSFISLDTIQAAVSVIVDAALASDTTEQGLYDLVRTVLDGKDTDPAVKRVILVVARDVLDKADWTQLTPSLLNDVVDLVVDKVKDKYGKYPFVNELMDELKDPLNELVHREVGWDTINKVREVFFNAIDNAVAGIDAGKDNEALLAQARADLLKLSPVVSEEMQRIGAKAADLISDHLKDKITNALPGIRLPEFIGSFVGGLAQDVVNEKLDEYDPKLTATIDQYVLYLTCPGHDYHYITTRATTCTEDGEEKLKCSKCGWVRSDNKITHKKLGHVPVVDEAADPTETEEGLTEGSHCARCGAVLEAQEVIPALQPQMDAKLVCSAIPEETVTAMRYENRKKLDAAMDAALTKAGYTAADSQRFLAQVNSSIGILPSDRYPEEGFTGYVPRPAQTAADKKYTWYAVQLLTVDAHGCNAGDVIITPVAQTDKGLQLTVYAQAVVALAWKEAK